MNRAIWARVGVLVTLIAMAAGTTTMLATEGFDAARWQAQRGKPAPENQRRGMLPTVRKALQAGMARQDIEVMLGAPDWREGRRSFYAIGTSGFGVDHEHFILDFDEQDRLAQHAVVRG